MRAALIGLFLLPLPALIPSAARAQARAARPAGEARIPNFLGATGLLRTPGAAVLRDREIALHVAGDPDRAAGGVSVGISGRFEVGVLASDSDSGAVRANAKWNVFPETLLRPALSVGVTDARDAGRANGYLVVSKYVIPYFVEALTGKTTISVKIHAGYGGGIYDHNLFAGAELILPGDLSGIAEISASRVNLGARYQRRRLSLTAAIFDFDRVGGAVSYTLP